MTPFSQRSLDFLYFNHKYNSKLWYQEHKEDFKQYLSFPFRDLVVAMSPRMLEIDEQMITEPKSIVSRLYKDLRFAKDKTSLYRDHMWLTFMRGTNAMCGLPGYFFELSPYNFRYGCGYYMADAKSMASLRNLILSNAPVFQKAKECFDFVLKTSGMNGYLSEQVDNASLSPSWIIGLGWSHAMFIIVLEKYMK